MRKPDKRVRGTYYFGELVTCDRASGGVWLVSLCDDAAAGPPRWLVDEAAESVLRDFADAVAWCKAHAAEESEYTEMSDESSGALKGDMSMRAGDVIRHRLTGVKFRVGAVRGDRVYPHSCSGMWALASEFELIEGCSDERHAEEVRNCSREGFVSTSCQPEPESEEGTG